MYGTQYYTKDYVLLDNLYDVWILEIKLHYCDTKGIFFEFVVSEGTLEKHWLNGLTELPFKLESNILGFDVIFSMNNDNPHPDFSPGNVPILRSIKIITDVNGCEYM